jgi:hypothetical protein
MACPHEGQVKNCSSISNFITGHYVCRERKFNAPLLRLNGLRQSKTAPGAERAKIYFPCRQQFALLFSHVLVSGGGGGLISHDFDEPARPRPNSAVRAEEETRMTDGHHVKPAGAPGISQRVESLRDILQKAGAAQRRIPNQK